MSNQQIDWDGLLTDISGELEIEYSQDLVELELNKNILRDLIDEGKNIQKKNAEELKKTNQTETKLTKNKPLLFNTKAYKLNENIGTNDNSDKKLTREEIRKARLEKFI